MRDRLAVSPHPDASALGNRLLDAGRTAAEAAVAMGAYLSVAMPHFCGIGGDAVWMMADIDGNVRALTGIGQAFSFVGAVSHIEPRGPGSILTSCGAVATWIAALEAVGADQDDLEDLLRPAADAARDGIAVTPSQDFWRAFRVGESQAWPGFCEYRAASVGTLLRQPALADSLERLIRDGLRSFYDGALAAILRDDLARLGVDISADDLPATRCDVGPGVSLPYRDCVLHAPPPPTQGATTLEIMGILDRLGPAAGADDYHLMVEAVKRAFLDRPRIEDGAERVVAGLLDPALLDRRAADIDRRRAMPWPHRFRQADTVYFAARDRHGGCVSALQSTYFDWGSGCRLERSGILWHNRGASFSLRDGSNRLRPGRRPFHTLNPGIATRNAEPWLLYGTQGADGQPQTLSVLLRHAIDRDMPPSRALAAPRFLLGRTFSDDRDTLKLEPTGYEAELAARGHAISPLPALSPLAGQAGMIRIEGGIVTGAHDPRTVSGV